MKFCYEAAEWLLRSGKLDFFAGFEISREGHHSVIPVCWKEVAYSVMSEEFGLSSYVKYGFVVSLLPLIRTKTQLDCI